ncbi:MAG TPA: GNAT family protein [Steroidobacteraceae bacterium]|jgi:RimJ/RimL family protein N-acetyltransferase|nr:GNAT family protein [Steroidobacteraceae bacterium]
MSDTTLTIAPTLLAGRHVRLEPLARSHIPGLLAAAREDPALYQWSAIPQGVNEMAQYVDLAIAWREAGTALPFASVRSADGAVIGSTRFFLIERWAWPAGHAGAARGGPDGCEIGYTWLSAGAVRSAANTEAKLLMLRHAFEAWEVHGVCFHTDVRNERSRAALARIGARFEGVLRAHRLAADLTPRDSARFSIVRAEWPAVKERLQGLLAARGG